MALELCLHSLQRFFRGRMARWPPALRIPFTQQPSTSFSQFNCLTTTVSINHPHLRLVTTNDLNYHLSLSFHPNTSHSAQCETCILLISWQEVLLGCYKSPVHISKCWLQMFHCGWCVFFSLSLAVFNESTWKVSAETFYWLKILLRMLISLISILPFVFASTPQV